MDYNNEAAVMQTLAENEELWNFYKENGSATLGEFAAWLKKNKINNTYCEVLNSYLEHNEAARDLRVLHAESERGDGKEISTQLLIGGKNEDGSNKYYVCYQGTQDNEWLDNAEIMTSMATPQQMRAADFYDRMVEKYGIQASDHLAVTGHSKGGNNAQYVTMAADNADLVDECLALDAPGFSPETVAAWQKMGGIYDERRNKITLIAGEYDYVHALGIAIAPAVAYIAGVHGDGFAHAFEGDGTPINTSDLGGDFKAYHVYSYMFAQENGKATYKLTEARSGPSKFTKCVMDINEYLMSLPIEEREAPCKLAMKLMMLGKESLDGNNVNIWDLMQVIEQLHDVLKEYCPELMDSIEELINSNLAPGTSLIVWSIKTLASSAKEYQRQMLETKKAVARIEAVGQARNNPRVCVDTDEFVRLSMKMSQLAGFVYEMSGKFDQTSFAMTALKNDLSRLKTDIQSAWDKAEEDLRKSKELKRQAERERDEAIENIKDFDLIGAVESGYDAVKHSAESKIKQFEAAIDVAEGLVNALRELWNIVDDMLGVVNQAIMDLFEMYSLRHIDDMIRDGASYLSETAMEFGFANDAVKNSVVQIGG